MSEEQDTQSIIAADVEIVGTIKCSGSLRVDGKVEGELNCSADLTVGKNATLRGNLTVNSVTVEGSVQGNIAAKDRIAMKSTARVTGDISAKRLSVEDGVTFIGKSEVNPAKSGSAPQPAATETKQEEQKSGMFVRR